MVSIWVKMLKSAKAPWLLGCEKRKKYPTLLTNPLSYQQNKGFHCVLLVLVVNPYKFVRGLKLF